MQKDWDTFEKPSLGWEQLWTQPGSRKHRCGSVFSLKANRSIHFSCPWTLLRDGGSVPSAHRPSQTWLFPESSLLQLPLPAAQAVGFSSPGFQERHLISCARDFVPCHKVIDHQPACRLAALGPRASPGSVHCDWVSLRTKHMPVPAQLWARRAVTAPLAW